MTTKQFFLSYQWLVFSQLLRAFSSCLSYFSALFNTSDYYVLETLFCYLKCPQTLLLSFFPLYAFRHSFFLSPSLKLTCTFVHSHKFKYHFWFVSSQICREDASHLSVFTCWLLSKEYVFPLNSYLSGVSLNMSFSENFDTFRSRSHFPFLVYYSVLCPFFIARKV